MLANGRIRQSLTALVAWDVTAGGILRTGVLICLVVAWKILMKFEMSTFQANYND